MNQPTRLSARPVPSGCLVLALLFALGTVSHMPAAAVFAITIQAGGAWTCNVPAVNMPTVPGTDMTITTYTSPSPQVTLKVTEPNNFGWRVDVSKVDSVSPGWHSHLHLWIQWSCTDNKVLGTQNTWVEILDDPTTTTLFWCTQKKHNTNPNVACTFQVRGVSVVVGTTNSTTVYYTVTEV